MAKASWVLVNPSAGQGNASVAVSSSAEHTGRVARQTTLTITAADCEDVYVSVNQQGKQCYVAVPETATAQKAGQTVTIEGISNAELLNFTLGSGNLVVELPANYTAAGVETPNNTAIAGDPGATAEYNFSMKIVVPANESVEELTKQVIVSDGDGHSDIITIKQAAGDAHLSVSKNSIELDYLGTAVSFDVVSNTSWTIS